jgi:hypothetical protein
MLGQRLPAAFGGYPVAFDVTRDPGSGARHRVEIFGLGGWLAWRLGFDPREGVTARDWLAAPWQRLAEVTTGAVFHDGTRRFLVSDRDMSVPGVSDTQT